MKHVKFRVPIYGADVWVVIDEEEASRLAAVKCGVFNEDFNMNGAVSYGNDKNVVWLSADCTVRTMAHEAMHVVLNICHSRGIIVDTNNQEPVTYLTGHIVSEILRAHNKLKERSNVYD
ncbi:hypothetical protein A7G67_22850 [Salmonella enterica subsp. enterica serovar Newport]|nr:hypothetical protein [Salmonella enterica subsp. enterica serovar Newport]